MGNGRWQRVAWALVAVEAIFVLADYLLGPYARVHWEERFNARAGVMVACGHGAEVFRLQYRTFCGGCTAEALLAAPLYRLLGPTVLAWKLVPATIHLGATALGILVAGRAAGPRAGVAFAGIMLGAPAFYRELAISGWGNHAESALFTLGACALLVVARGKWRGPLLFVAGVVAGLGFWFCHTSAHAIPALLLLAVLASRWLWPLFVAGLPLGALPWWLYHHARSQEKASALAWWTRHELASPEALFRWLAGPYLREGLWPAVDFGQPGWLPHAWWFAFWGLALLGFWSLLRGTGHRGARLFPPLALLTLLAVYAVRHDLWAQAPEVPPDPTLGLRYLAPLLPLLMFGAASAAARWRGAAFALTALAGFGVAMRASAWTHPRTEAWGLRVYAHDGWEDRSVPTGDPPQRLARALGRPQDVAAALDWLASHEDPLGECRQDHLFELGRRLGVALRTRDADAELARAPLSGAHDRRVLADGIAQGLDDRAHADAVLDRWEVPPIAGFDLDLARAVGRHLASRHRPEDALPARYFAGVCEWRGAERARLRAAGEPGYVVDALAGPCLGWPSYDEGVGRGHARHVGCREVDEAALRAEVTDAAVALAALASACPFERTGSAGTDPR